MPATPQPHTLDYFKYLGRPWVAGEYDCWSLVRDLYQDVFGIELPLVCVDADSPKSVLSEFRDSLIYEKFHHTTTPRHMAVAVMSQGARATHVGVYLVTADGPRVMHCDRDCGTVIEQPSKMPYSFRYYV